MLTLLLFVVVLLLAAVSGHLKRASRRLVRIPCVVCGCPLLPAARFCPSCRSRQPLRGWAGRRERMWQTAPAAPRTNLILDADAAPSAPSAPSPDFWWIAALVISFFVVVFALVIAADPAPVARQAPPTHATAPPPTEPGPGWDHQSDGSYKIHRPSAPAKPPVPVAAQAQGPVGYYDQCAAIKDATWLTPRVREFCRGHSPDPTPVPASKPRTPMDDCLALLGAMRLTNGGIEWWSFGFSQALDDYHSCQTRTGQ